ncbi:hypothetical protein T439DRAFT_321839 [Meredithblackwellia eburnea MCA 4105]
MATILILGGLGEDRTRTLLPYLLSPAGPSPAFVRVVDKYLCIPQADAYTTYVDVNTRAALKKGVETGVAEYVQGNLLTDSTRTKVFTLPAAHGGPSKGFDYVYDFSGEVDYELKDAVHIERTLKLALLLGQSAVEHCAGVYLRSLAGLYKVAGGKKGKVGDEGIVSEPWGTKASWHHEAARGLAQIKGLKLVLLRPAIVYGPFTVSGITPRVLIGEVYKYEGEKLEFLWAEGLAQNTIHSEDAASAAVAVAVWASSKSRDEITSLAGEELPTTLSSDSLVKDIPGAAKKDSDITAPVFSIVDDGETTTAQIAKVIAEVVGVEAGFHGTLISQFAKMNMKDVIEDVNEKHLEGWSALLTNSKPAISTTVPISPHTAADTLQPYPIQFSSEKLKKLTGWKPTHKLTPEIVRETVEGFRNEGNWPNATPKSKKK